MSSSCVKRSQPCLLNTFRILNYLKMVVRARDDSALTRGCCFARRPEFGSLTPQLTRHPVPLLSSGIYALCSHTQKSNWVLYFGFCFHLSSPNIGHSEEPEGGQLLTHLQMMDWILTKIIQYSVHAPNLLHGSLLPKVAGNLGIKVQQLHGLALGQHVQFPEMDHQHHQNIKPFQALGSWPTYENKVR